MKKRLAIAAMVLLLCAPLLAGGFSLKIMGGVAALSGGDYNLGVQGSNDLNLASFSNVNGAFAKLNRGLNLGVEGILRLSPRFGVGLGVGFCRTREGNTVTYDWNAGSTSYHDSITANPDFYAIPVTLNLHYYAPPLGPVRLDLTAGAGVYVCRFNYDDKFSSSQFDWSYHYTWKASKIAFGAQAGLGVEVALSRVLSLVLEVFGRYARVGNIRGAWTIAGSMGGFPYAESGDDHFFWYYELASGEKVYSQTALQLHQPRNFAVSNARKGHFDYTGVAAAAGFKINL
jgi:hypothetical protein